MRTMQEVKQYVKCLAEQQTCSESYSPAISTAQPINLIDSKPLRLVGQFPEWIDILFGRFTLIFGNKWTDSLNSEPMIEACKQEWTRWANTKYRAECLNKDVINLAIDLAADASNWPPSMKEFGEHITAALDKMRRAMPALPATEEDEEARIAREREARLYSADLRDIVTRKHIELGDLKQARLEAEKEHDAIWKEIKQARIEGRNLELKSLIQQVREELATQVLKNDFLAVA